MTDNWESEGGFVPQTKLYKSYRWMHRMYKVKRLNEEEIAELAGVDQSTINRWLKKHKLKD